MMRNWSIMVLLSTLAALVILVHTEDMEDLEMDYHHDLAPRVLEAGASSYDQTWRAVRAEPVMQKPTQVEDWSENHSPEEAPRRRRPGRKRKRRPLEDPHEEANERQYDHEETRVVQQEEPDERRFYHEEPRRHRDTEYPALESTDPPRRRRKRPEMGTDRWLDEPNHNERPLRRRGQRWKRPIRPKSSEHDVFTEDKVESDNEDMRSKKHSIDQGLYKGLTFDEDRKNDETGLEIPKIEFRDEVRIRPNPEDKSILDVSQESEPLGAKGNPIDPLTLKEILKRSNGTSLSEILQQHNLSLADLLHGKENAISILKAEDAKSATHSDENQGFRLTAKEKEDLEKMSLSLEVLTNEQTTTQVTAFPKKPSNETEKQKATQIIDEDKKEEVQKPEILDAKEDSPKLRRKLPPGGRRRLRLKVPKRNNTIRMQPNKEFIHARRQQLQNNVSTLKYDETEMSVEGTLDPNNMTVEAEMTTVMTTTTEEIITQYIDTESDTKDIPTTTIVRIKLPTTTDMNSANEDTKTNDIESTEALPTTTQNREIDTTESTTEQEYTTTTEKPLVTPIIRSKPLNNSDLRRQALTNRLKRKRLKQKHSTTESPQDNLTKDLFGMANLVSASEFISRMQSPKTTKSDDTETTLDDLFVTEATSRMEKYRNLPRYTITRIPVLTTTEDTAQIEIEEILNDTNSGARLSKILMERNMTLNELVEHRERGSSQVHLADIFHNTSVEPNPPEPFLSKSAIEPISKETYPLRALLDANLHEHESTVKPTTIEPNPPQTQYSNIPVVMDYGNNVNENAENLGIMSLFNKIAGSHIEDISDKSIIKKDSEGTPYISSVISVNITQNTSENTREGRAMEVNPGMVTLNDIFSHMHRSLSNETPEFAESFTKAFVSPDAVPKVALETDREEDGIKVVEDLQNLKDYGSNIATALEENIKVATQEKEDSTTREPGIFDKIPSGTKSVTVATASIVGLTMVVFLLTYAAFKWRQQRNLLRKKESFSEERIPTPVFESRKGHKNQSSNRSISPMLSNTNIYTMSTLDSSNGKESPDYAWDSLTKPFQ